MGNDGLPVLPHFLVGEGAVLRLERQPQRQ